MIAPRTTNGSHQAPRRRPVAQDRAFRRRGLHDQVVDELLDHRGADAFRRHGLGNLAQDRMAQALQGSLPAVPIGTDTPGVTPTLGVTTPSLGVPKGTP